MSDQVQGLSGKVSLDVTDYKSGIVELNRNIRLIDSGFRASAASLGDWDRTANGLEQRVKALTDMYDLQKDKVILLTREQRKIAAEKGATSRAAQDLQIRINKETESLNKMGKELSDTKGDLQKMGDQAKETGKEVKKLGDEQDKTAKSSKQMSAGSMDLNRAVGSIAAKAAGALLSIAALREGIRFLWSTVQAGSDLSETTSKVSVVFGNMSKEIVKWGDSAATSLGMSKNQALSAAGTFGNLFSAMGIGKQTTLDMSTGLVELSADLASFNNLDTKDVLESLRSGISGETEPLKKLGININEVTLKEKAREMGLWNGKGALDASAKAQASYALIMEQTSLAQGDFERTSEGLANQQRILAAQFENIKGSLGTGLLPMITAVVTALGGYMGRIQNILGGNMSLNQKVFMLSGVFRNLAQDIAKSLPGITQTVLMVIQALITGLVGALPTLMPAVVQIILTLVNGLLQMLPMLITAAIQIIIALATGLTQALPELIPTVVAIIPQIVILLLENLPLIIDAALNLIIALAMGLVAALPVLIPQIPKIVQKIVELLIQNLPLILVAAIQIIVALAMGLIENLPLLLQAVVDIIVGIIDAFKNTNWKEIGDNIVAGIKTGFLDKWEGFKTSVATKFKELWGYIKDLLGIHSPSTVFADIGSNMALGMGVGFGEQMNAVRRQMRGAVNGLTAGMNVPVNVTTQGGVQGQQVVGANGKTYQLYFETYNEAAMSRTLRQVEMLYG